MTRRRGRVARKTRSSTTAVRPKPTIRSKVIIGRSKVIIGPVWRRDRRAVALLRKDHRGLTVEVRTASSPYPLVRHVPRTFRGKPHLFWIGPRRVGLGPAPLVPRVVLSWEPMVLTR